MSPRELVILLLGLAIVAVVLRGLYVAIQARRGQIRLAIDKNIPSDVDLDALEMAELPSGGARVINRDNPDGERVERASARAEALDLGGDDEVPVLMDAVQVRSRPAVAGQDDRQTELLDEIPSGDEEDEDPDAVLMDYGEDNLAAVAPDYEEEDEADAEPEGFDPEYDPHTDADEEHWDEAAAEAQDSEADDYQESDYDEADEGDYPESDFDEDYDENPGDQLEDDQEQIERSEPALGSLDDDFDEFSMTAGERIGFEGQPRKEPARQTSLFDEQDSSDERAGPRKKSRRKSLFAAFSRKKEAAPEPEVDELQDEQQDQRQDQRQVDLAAGQSAARPMREPVDIEEQEETTKMAPAASEESSSNAPRESTHVGEPSEVLVISIMAREGRVFAGDDLLHALITAGLKFGDMNIFHQRLTKDSNSPVIFSVANILNPGTFDLNAMDDFTTVGISFFLALPSPINNLDAFDKMLTAANQIRSALDGELKDDNRNGMTAQTIEHYRQRVRDFELRKLKAAGGRA